MLHSDHDIENFRPPIGMATDMFQPFSYKITTPAQVSSLTICLQSIHRYFDAFVSIDPMKLRVFPSVIFMRLLYTGIAFLKFTSIVKTSESLSSMFGVDDLKVEEYLDKVLARLSEITDNGKQRFRGDFLERFNMMKSGWLSHNSRNESRRAASRADTSSSKRLKTSPDQSQSIAIAESIINPVDRVFRDQEDFDEVSPDMSMDMSIGGIYSLKQPGNAISWAWDAFSFSNAMDNADSGLQ